MDTLTARLDDARRACETAHTILNDGQTGDVIDTVSALLACAAARLRLTDSDVKEVEACYHHHFAVAENAQDRHCQN